MSYTEELVVHGGLSTEEGIIRIAHLDTEGSTDFLVDELVEFYMDHYRVFALHPVDMEVEPATEPGDWAMVMIEADPSVIGESGTILLELGGDWAVINEVARAFKARMTGNKA